MHKYSQQIEDQPLRTWDVKISEGIHYDSLGGSEYFVILLSKAFKYVEWVGAEAELKVAMVDSCVAFIFTLCCKRLLRAI